MVSSSTGRQSRALEANSLWQDIPHSTNQLYSNNPKPQSKRSKYLLPGTRHHRIGILGIS